MLRGVNLTGVYKAMSEESHIIEGIWDIRISDTVGNGLTTSIYTRQ